MTRKHPALYDNTLVGNAGRFHVLFYLYSILHYKLPWVFVEQLVYFSVVDIYCTRFELRLFQTVIGRCKGVCPGVVKGALAPHALDFWDNIIPIYSRPLMCFGVEQYYSYNPQ